MKSVIFTRATGTPTLRAAAASPPQAKIQLPKRVRSSTQVKTAVSASHHRIDTGMPCTIGSPSGRVAMIPCAAIQSISGRPNCPAKNCASQSPAVASWMPETWVRPGQRARHDPERQPAQHEQRAQRHDEGRQPGLHHDKPVEIAHHHRAPRRPARAPATDGQPQSDRRNRDHDAGEADHRPDRQVELAGDHQQRHRRREDAELRRDLEEIHDALGAEQPARPGDDQRRTR